MSKKTMTKTSDTMALTSAAEAAVTKIKLKVGAAINADSKITADIICDLAEAGHAFSDISLAARLAVGEILFECAIGDNSDTIPEELFKLMEDGGFDRRRASEYRRVYECFGTDKNGLEAIKSIGWMRAKECCGWPAAELQNLTMGKKVRGTFLPKEIAEFTRGQMRLIFCNEMTEVIETAQKTANRVGNMYQEKARQMRELLGKKKDKNIPRNPVSLLIDAIGKARVATSGIEGIAAEIKEVTPADAALMLEALNDFFHSFQNRIGAARAAAKARAAEKE